MDLLTPASIIHRSTADWSLGAWCLLDPTHATSPPTALSNQNGAQCWAVLDHPDAFNVTHGRITVQIYAVPATPTWFPYTEIAFRCDASPAYPLSPRFYYLDIYHDAVWPPATPHVKLYRYQAPTSTLLAQWAFNPPNNAWTRYRLSWLPGCTALAIPSFQITLQYWDGAAWALIGTVYDPTNLGLHAPDNQVALSLYYDQHWTDDFRLEDFT